ncbi:MAG TPA: alpha/beta hydrolase [Gemmatimonadaceae bacterium]|nr:alpha/beta hydrolase [Gemmatimonadaceae bacterium]
MTGPRRDDTIPPRISRHPGSGRIEPDILRVPVSAGALHVDRYGHGGRPVVLLHGFPTCSFVWRWVAPTLAQQNLTPVAIDLLGYGESDRPYDGDFGITAQAEYLDQAMTALRIARAPVVGLDLGAAVALKLAATRPDRVERLVLVNPVALGDLPADDVKSVQRNTARFAFRITRGVMGAAPLLKPVLEGSVAAPESMPYRLVARYLAPFVGKDGVAHLIVLARSVRAQDLLEMELAAVDTPALIVWGEGDRWASERLPELLERHVAGSRVVRLRGVGRLVPEEAPERLTELVLDFCQGTVPARGGY